MKVQGNGHEHEFEAAYGLPEPLPKGECILWQGAPDFSDLAVRVFHLKKVAVYFVVLMFVRGSYLYSLDEPALTILAGILLVAALGLTAMAALGILAWLTARTTAYTLTDQRIVMRIGIVLTLTFNLPLKRIETAGLLLTGKGFGDIPLALSGGDRIGWLNLWPHARPWRLAKPEPMLRCIPQAQSFASILQKAWTQASGRTNASLQTHGEMGGDNAAYWGTNALNNKSV
ncbi:MAG: photosynthetic complex putative assembly protein PuhB [Polaromonas sp.]